MTGQIPVIVIITALILVLFVVFIIEQRKTGEPHAPNYRTLFIVGISWLPLGIAADNPGFWGIGAVMMIVGLVNKNKWKNAPKWSELSPEAKRLKLIAIIGLSIILLFGVVTYFLTKSGVVG